MTYGEKAMLELRHALVFALALTLPALAIPAWAGKPEKQSDVPRVGVAQAVRVVPEASRFVRETELGGASFEVWRDTLKVPGAAFLKPRFSNLNLAPGDVLIVRSKSGEVVEELQELGPRREGSFWGLSAFGDELRFELRARSRYLETAVRDRAGDRRRPADAGRGGGADAAFGKCAIESICAPEDYDDAICWGGYRETPPKWANVLASAGVMTAAGGIALWCSGSPIFRPQLPAHQLPLHSRDRHLRRRGIRLQILAHRLQQRRRADRRLGRLPLQRRNGGQLAVHRRLRADPRRSRLFAPFGDRQPGRQLRLRHA